MNVYIINYIILRKRNESKRIPRAAERRRLPSYLIRTARALKR
jgi:hypothetical protein